MITLETLLTDIPRIQAKYHPKLEKLKLRTVGDLLRHFPSRYDDLAETIPIISVRGDRSCTIMGTVEKVASKTIPGKRLTITTATFSDDSATIRATWFNQKFLEKNLVVGKQFRVSGRTKVDKSGVFFSAPDIENATSDPRSTGRIVPIYPETAGITSKWLRWQIKLVLDSDIILPDILTGATAQKYDFPTPHDAMRAIHFPDNPDHLENAQRRFAFEDLFLLQVYALTSQAKHTAQSAHTIPFDQQLITQFVANLPFDLTDAQRKASFQILKDLEKPRPMNRLLNGDVGAGKTLVATIAALQVAHDASANKEDQKKQVALLAPTEVLACQHFFTFLRDLEDYDCNIALLTGAYKIYGTCEQLAQTTTKTKLLEKIADGSIDIIIGTHALIQDTVSYKDLALVIVDEQQRFGVGQRSALIDMAHGAKDHTVHVPHFLTMTATPIPRTFALAIFGDLSVSLLDEKPANRKDIKTAIVTPSKQKNIYTFISEELTAGRQGYVILPLVEKSDVGTMAHVKAAKEEQERLQKDVFPDYTVGLLHGKMKSAEKERVMKEFKEHKIDLLVATSVVEVGVDVPNATVMIIENAERFGLSQLHQFRGRIGRSDLQSYCFLFTANHHNARLKALEKHNDGFALAEIDLDLRGPGEFIGRRQSGLPDGAMKNIANIALVTQTREAARHMLITDPGLKNNPDLRGALMHFRTRIHME